MLSFHNPQAFVLFALLPALALLRKSKMFVRPSVPLILCDWGGEGFMWQGRVRKTVTAFATLLEAAGFLAAVTAFADPALLQTERVYTSRGTDIIFALDISPSMAARDVSGTTRLDAAKQAILMLAVENPGYAYGLVVMAEDAALSLPPTADAKRFADALASAALGAKGDGTALGVGIASAVFHLASSGAPKKCIILVTDGENNAGAIHPETAAALAAKNGCALYAIGVGSAGSAPIEYRDPETGKTYSGYLSSSFNPAELKKLAQLGGGRYFAIHSIEDLSLALQVISRNEGTAQTFRTRTAERALYAELAGLAAVLFALSYVIRRIPLGAFL